MSNQCENAVLYSIINTERNDFGYNDRTNVTNISEIALLRIFLGSRETSLFKQGVSVQWYEIVGNVGGLCGVICGFSLISSAEVVYLIGRLAVKYCRRSASAGRVGSASGSTKSITDASANDETEFYILP